MIFEIINPSDKCTLETDEYRVATFVSIILGRGKYGLNLVGKNVSKEDEEAYHVPMFLFKDPSEWIAENFEENNLDDFLDDLISFNAKELSDCFYSVAYTDAEGRDEYNKKLESFKNEKEKLEWMKEWNDEKRSSLNNIVGLAFEYGEHFKSLSENQK